MNSEDKIKKILDAWRQDLEDFSRAEQILHKLMMAEETAEVNKIAQENINFIDRKGLWKAVINARKRILTILKHKKKIWGETLN